MKKLLIAHCSLLIALSACTFQTKRRGYIFPENLETEIAAVKTADELEEKFGSPPARTVFGDTVWIYYGADENYHGPFPITYDNKTALLVWSRGGKITGTRILRDGDLPDVWVDPDETAIPAAIELNALEELVNNVGRFTPEGLGQ